LKPDATEADVKSAWRRLVSQWHPDRNPSAHAGARMQRINLALETLRRAGFAPPPPATTAQRSGPRARPAASQAGRARPAPPPSPPPAAPPPPPEAEAATDADGERGTRTLHRKVKLTLEQAALGCTVVLRGRFNPVCSRCAGLGHTVLGGACGPCGGSGALRQAGWYGLFSNTAECEHCHGSGRAQRACVDCAGKGRLGARSYRMSVRIPHGARDGDRLHVPARGTASPGDIDLRVQLSGAAPRRSGRPAGDGGAGVSGTVHGRADGFAESPDQFLRPPPERLRRFPPRGATPAARRSRFRGVCWGMHCGAVLLTIEVM